MSENRKNCVLCGSKIVLKYTTQLPVPVRPNLNEITDIKKMKYWDIVSKFLEW